MSKSGTRPVRLALLALALVVVGALGVSASAFGRSNAKSCGTVTLDENAWAGATANVYVVKYVLEKNLGCKVNIEKLPESTPLFQAMADGKVDVLLEDWNNIQLKVNQKYVKSGQLIDLGSNGVIGHIGWFVPTYLMKQYPQLKTWQGLKGKESIFKSPESGSQGMFLGGDPSYVQKDSALIKGLGLDLKHVVAGAEPAQVARWSQLYKQKKPVLFYWYDPQYLNAQYDLVQVQLPKRFAGCQDDEKKGGDPKKYACAYPSYRLDKLVSSDFLKSGSPALKVIRNFKWTSADQNFVANLISGKKQSKEKAAAAWVKANAKTVNSWLK